MVAEADKASLTPDALPQSCRTTLALQLSSAIRRSGNPAALRGSDKQINHWGASVAAVVAPGKP